MITEFFQHMALPAEKWVKRMGYGREAVAMTARHGRCRDAWASHLDTCRRLITEAAEACPAKDHAVVLGSGPLLDIPLDGLAATFQRVDLVDMVHGRAVRRMVQAYTNVNLVEADISGVARAVYRKSPMSEPLGDRPRPPIGMKDKSCAVIESVINKVEAMGEHLTSLPDPRPNAGLIEGADFVVSSNLLSQLPLQPLDWLAAHCPWADEAMRETLARAIVDHHLALLQSHPGRVVLITEVLRLLAGADVPVQKIDPLFGAQIMYEGEEWWWEIAPRPEIDRNHDLRLRVLGIGDLANAPQSRICRNTTLAAP